MNENLSLPASRPAPCRSSGGPGAEPCTTSTGLQTFTGALFLLAILLVLALVCAA